MADKRRLNIPTYGTAGDNEDIIDAEVIESPGERLRSAGRRARERVAGSRRQARARREQAQQERQERSQSPRAQREAYAKAESQEGRQTRREASRGDQLSQLKVEMEQARQSYLNSLAASGVLAEKTTKPEQRQKLSALHQAYASMMVMQCVQPLRNGLGAANVLSTVGMGSMMWMLSPNFRTQVGSFAQDALKSISERIEGRERREAKIRAQGEKAQEKLDQLYDSKGKGRESLSSKWRKRLEKMEHMERGYRDPFTEHSAALTQVGLMESAYREMRRPGADPAAVRDSYESAISTLYEYIEDDGLDKNEVASNLRVIVGQRIDKDPAVASMYNELGHGRFIKGEPQEVFIPGTTKKTKAWLGDYKDSFSGYEVKGGTFSLREPMDADQHRVAASQAIFGEMVSSKSMEDLNAVMEQYMVGSAARTYPEAVDLIDDPQTQARLGRARTMFHSMSEDGLSSQDQKLVYMGAYLDALRETTRLNPELFSQWEQRFGPDWERTVMEAMDRYSDLGEEAVDPTAAPRTEQEEPVVVVQEESEPGPRFTSSTDGAVYDHEKGSETEFDEDIIDAEIVEDEPEHEAEPEQQTEAPSVDETGTLTFDDPETDQAESEGGQNELNQTEVLMEQAGLFDAEGHVDDYGLNSLEDSAVSLERAAARGAGFGSVGHAEAAQSEAELVEAMSDHMAADILQSAQRGGGQDKDGNSWLARHAYRSRERALGKLDPARMAQSRRDREQLNTMDWYDRSVDDAAQASHAPWDSDLGSNTRAREMVAMTRQMSQLSMPPKAQDRLHSVAYVRALEKVVHLDPSYEQALRTTTAREGGRPEAWREHEYRTSMSHTRTGVTRETYSSASAELELGDLRTKSLAGLSESARSQAIQDLSSALRGSTSLDEHKADIELNRTSSRVRRHRQNLAYNGYEVNSGRFASNEPKPEQPGPELGL